MTVPTAPAATPGAPGLPAGAAREATVYYDTTGRRRTSANPVPVDQFGQLVAGQYACRIHKTTYWFPLSIKDNIPTCPACNRKMRREPIRRAPLLPWRQLWQASNRHLCPVAALPVAYGAGAALHTTAGAGLVMLGLAPAAGVVATRAARRRGLKVAEGRGRVDGDAPGSDKRIRAAIDRQARVVGYGVAAAAGWLAVAGELGVDGHTVGGVVSLAALAAVWGLPAATWWRKLRTKPAPPATVEAAGDLAEVPMNPDEAYTRRIWANIVAAQKGQRIGALNGEDVVAARNGKLVETHIEDWRPVEGGCAWTAVSPPGLYVAESFLSARPAVASAFRMKTSMITCIPDPEDETRALYLAQRHNPIAEDVRWAGPASINVETGRAPVARYIDGGLVPYEIYRPGWGVPHVAAFGTTGSGKSEFLNLLFAVDRWAHYLDDNGQPHGLVADFLIDPQQGQSFAPFLDDLAAPVATTLDEAMFLVEALTAEMLRRNRYLAREAKWWDEKRKRWRTGRKWWNPLVDGPILALTIDEAHDFLSHKPFAAAVAGAARMWRKCGGQLRIGTHTPLLTDLGGSMALRDMLTGGFVWVGRTANRLSGPTAFNGRLPVDPCTIPQVPGMSYILSGLSPQPMLARAMFEPDWYDWVRDERDRPVGYPGVLPRVTLDRFGPEFGRWVEAAKAGDDWAPASDTSGGSSPDESQAAVRAMDAVMLVLAKAPGPVSMDELGGLLRQRGFQFSTRTVRDVLAKLRKAEPPLVESGDGRHRLTGHGMGEALSRAELVNA